MSINENSHSQLFIFINANNNNICATKNLNTILFMYVLTQPPLLSIHSVILHPLNNSVHHSIKSSISSVSSSFPASTANPAVKVKI